jgi:hypothetical protein
MRSPKKYIGILIQDLRINHSNYGEIMPSNWLHKIASIPLQLKDVPVISEQNRKEYAQRYGPPNVVCPEGSGGATTLFKPWLCYLVFVDDDTGQPVAYIPPRT